MPPARRSTTAAKTAASKACSPPKASKPGPKTKKPVVNEREAAKIAASIPRSIEDDSTDPDDPEPEEIRDEVVNNSRDSNEFSDTSSDEPLPESPKKAAAEKKKKANQPKKKKPPTKKVEETEFSFSDFSATSSDEVLTPSPSPRTNASNSTTSLSGGGGGGGGGSKEDISSPPSPAKAATPVPVDDMPVTFNQYYRHRCKLSKLLATRPISGQDICLPNRPAELPLDKLKLHYVVHYLHSGIWDHIVPPEDASMEGKIDFYLCNLCQKKFKNHLEKKEYPGRGSVLCHLATDHGLLVEAMRAEKKIDLEHDIRILAHNDKQFKESFDFGPETMKIPVDKLVTPKESMYWRMNLNKAKSTATTPTTTTTTTTTTSSSSTASTTTTSTTTAVKASAPAPAAITSPSTTTTSTTTNPSSGLSTPSSTTTGAAAGVRPRLLECPHCDELKGNTDAPNLRLHIFHHYKDRWTERIEKLSKGEKSFFCDRCPKKKKITGATMEGTRTAAVCHFAIQHYELRDVLEKDFRLTKQFVNELYWDHDNPNQATSTYYQAQSKAIRSQSATTPLANRNSRGSGNGNDRKAKRRGGSESDSDLDSDDSLDLDSTDVSSFDISSSDESDKPAKSAKSATKQKKASGGGKPGVIMPGETNPNYIRKRSKINFSLDSDDLDSASDHSWEKGSNRKKKKVSTTPSAGGGRKGQQAVAGAEAAGDTNGSTRKERVLPRRNVSTQKKVYNFQDDEEDLPSS